MKLVQGHTGGREKQGLDRTQPSGSQPIPPKCQVGPRAAGKRGAGERLPARVWNPFARPAVFSQGEVRGPGLPPPQHHLLPVYLFILKSHPPALLGAPNIPASLQRWLRGRRDCQTRKMVGSGLKGSCPSMAAPTVTLPYLSSC